MFNPAKKLFQQMKNFYVGLFAPQEVTYIPIPKQSKPVIGISMRCMPAKTDAFGQEFMVRQAEKEAVKKAGGSAEYIQHQFKRIPEYVKRLDGLLIPGNPLNIDDETKMTKAGKKRFAFEMALATAMIKAGKPVFGICGGFQVIVRLMGGKLIHHIPTEVQSKVTHNPGGDYRNPAHSIKVIDSKSAIAQALQGKITGTVNSIHEQGILRKDLPSGIIPVAIADDNIVEAYEIRDSKGKPIVMATQFHPEFRHDTGIAVPDTPWTATDQLSYNLLKLFVARAREGAVPTAHTATLVRHINSLNVLGKVKAAPYQPDYSKSVAVMTVPSAPAAIAKEGVPQVSGFASKLPPLTASLAAGVKATQGNVQYGHLC